jgi:hypothetical protein
MCTEVKYGEKTVDNCGGLAELIGSKVVLHDETSEPSPASCLCSVDFAKTLGPAGFEIDPDSCSWYVVIRKKGDD